MPQNDRLIDLITQQAHTLAKQGKMPTQVRINPQCYAEIVSELKQEIEKIRKSAARAYKADWSNPIPMDEEMPIDSILVHSGQLKFVLDAGLPEGFEVE